MKPSDRTGWSPTARQFRERLATDTPSAESALPDATMKAILREVVSETVAECMGAEVELTHVVGPTPEQCAAAGRCLPLSALPEVGVELAGHLHRTPSPDPDQMVGDLVPLEFLAALIASRAGRDLLDVRLAHAEHQAANLEVALESNRAIGVAVGVLMASRRCDAAAAFDLLRTASQQQNRKLRDIANDVAWAGVIPTPSRVAT